MNTVRTCSQCGGQTEMKSGISKKNGKPYVGYKCKDCKNMDFERMGQTYPAQAPIAPLVSEKEGQIIHMLLDTQRKLDDILLIVKGLESDRYKKISSNQPIKPQEEPF